ncbi:MAG: 5-(carboxyamino)imidazole ribonucleotide mutase [Methanocellales archaeon]|nr:5-(carboxyamino)imidazole ribonucleotide mutase [Methanocellales archaeon]
MREKVVVLMGSKKDLGISSSIGRTLEYFGIEYEFKVASAHKTPRKVLEILEEHEKLERVVYITVAGGSNALSGLVDANTTKPVIACPPYSEKFAGADIYSSLRMPSGIGSLVIIEPEGAAIAAAKVLAIGNKNLTERIQEYQMKKREEIDAADDAIKDELNRGR